MRRGGGASGFGPVGPDERRRAELFYADLIGRPVPRLPGMRPGEHADGEGAGDLEALFEGEAWGGEGADGEAWTGEAADSEAMEAEPIEAEGHAGGGAGGPGWSEDSELVEGSGPAPTCSVWLPAVTSSSYTDWVAAPTTGLVSLLINGRSSNGAGSDIDRTEPLDEMQRAVVALGAGDFCYLSAWFFEPSTGLTAGTYRGETTWGGLFGKKATEGVEIRILINDFDPFSGLDGWERSNSLVPMEALVRALPAAAQPRLKYLVTRHPANYAGARAAVIRRLHGGGSGPIFIGSHHQKFMVARRSGATTAFCGGLDVESRKIPSAWSYGGLIGWHDLTLKMEGPITRDVERQFVERWNREQSGARNALLPGWGSWGTLSMPAALPAADGAPAKRVHPVQLTRTVSSDTALAAYTNNRDDIQRAYRNIVSCARSHLYLENQYFRDLSLADEIAARGRAVRDLRAVFVVLASAAADDGANPLTSEGDALQCEFFNRIHAAFGARAGIYTMFNRSVHSKFILADDRAMSVGSANANVRSFDMDSELNITVEHETWARAARLRLWSHNLTVAEATIGTWAATDFVTRWNGIATANAPLRGTPASMAGEGVLLFNWRENCPSSSALIPDYLVRLDVAPAPNRIYGPTDAPRGGGRGGGDTRIA